LDFSGLNFNINFNINLNLKAGELFKVNLMGKNPLTVIVVTALSLFLIPLVSFFYARLYRKSLGGYTGDALGAAIETAEVLYLTALLFALP
jgi:cobalamin synthase